MEDLSPQPSDPLAEAERLAPAIAARAAEIEEARTLPADLVDRLARAGLFRLLQPAAYGGLELPPADALAAIERLARADAATAWCVMIGATSSLMAAYLPAADAAEIFADPEGVVGGVFAPMGRARVDGPDYIVSGRWSWASGSGHCRWLGGGCLIMDGDEVQIADKGRPLTRMMLFPREAVTLIDTWHAAGLKGTGSGDMAVEALRVPGSCAVDLIAGRPQVDGPLYAFPLFGLLALGVAAVAAGNARAALDEIADTLKAKRPAGGRKSLAEKDGVQTQLAAMEAAWRAGRAHIDAAVAQAWAVAQQQGSIGPDHRMGLRLAATHMTRTAADLVRQAYDLGGGAALYLSSSLQRRFRDAHAATQHIMVGPLSYELAGRVLLDQPADLSQL